VATASGEILKAPRRKPLVAASADRLRDMIFGVEPGTRIGALPTLAAQLGVGIVTVQQAARVLEHEGLLEVRRGPGGGYYGTRPAAPSLARTITAYIRTHPQGYAEALDILTLLFCELAAAAAASPPQQHHHAHLRALADRIDMCREGPETGAFEAEFQDLLFAMVDRPVFELLTHVALQLYADAGRQPFFGTSGIELWKLGRHRVIAAILARDPALARFEAERNRQVLMARLEQGHA
jgi:GntR family transcriptional repressor for pyruvate dehydrogenase complex